jgi:hypothetical protein
MKTFQEFILICEALNKTHDENSQSKIWNYFIGNPEQQEIRDLLLKKDYESAKILIRQEVEKAKQNREHPLNFQNAGEDEFSQKSGRQPGDERPYNKFLDDSISGLLALSKEKKIRKSIEKGLPTRVAGKSQAELSKRFNRDGGTDKTSKGDIEIYDPDNDKFKVGVSMKKGKGAQLASAESGELKGMVSSAARQYVKKFHSNKSREEKEKIEREIMGRIERVSQNQIDMRTADRDTQKNLKISSQEVLDNLNNDYPQLTRIINQVATSGKGKFKSQQGVADVVLTGKEGDVESSAISSERQKSSNLRAALPKGKNKSTGVSRPGNTKIDYKPEKESKSNQAQAQQGPKTLKQFERQARIAELKAKKEAQAQQELETQQAAQALKYAEKERADAQKAIETNPDGSKTYLQYQGQKIQNNPELNTRLVAANQNIQTASVTLDTIRQRAAQAQQQPTQTQPAPTTSAPAPEQQPTQTQPAPAPEQQPTQTQPAPTTSAPAPEQQPTQTQQPMVKSKSEPYKKDAIDRDGDGLVQDGTPHERPAPQPSPELKKKKNAGERMASAYDKKVDELIKT